MLVQKNHTKCVDKLSELWYSTNCTKRVVYFGRFLESEPGNYFNFVPQRFIRFLKTAGTDAFYGKGLRRKEIPGFQAGAAFAQYYREHFLERYLQK